MARLLGKQAAQSLDLFDFWVGDWDVSWDGSSGSAADSDAGRVSNGWANIAERKEALKRRRLAAVRGASDTLPS